MTNSDRQLVPGGTTWSEIVGYSRVVRVGQIVEVSGTVAMDGDEIIGSGDVYAQTKFILHKIEAAMAEVGAKMSDVTRTRCFVTDIAQQWKEAGRAHGEVFADIKPVTSMVEISGLINPEFLIEIEVSAVVQSQN